MPKKQAYSIIYDPLVKDHLRTIERRHHSFAPRRRGAERMKVASLVDVKAHLGAYVRESENEPIIITRKGRPVAVLLALEDPDEIERLILANSPRFQAMLDAARARIDAGQGIPHDQFWKE